MRAVCVAAALVVLVAAARRAEAISCTIQSVVGVAFGSYDVFSSSPVDSTGSITYRCTLVVPLLDTIVITISTGNAGSFLPRTMQSGVKGLAYNLYLDAARTLVWGTGADGTSRYGPIQPLESSDVTVPVYGRLPAGQDVPAGAYADTVVVTIIY